MDFNTLLKNLIEQCVHCFNSGNFEGLNDLFVQNVQFTAEAYENIKVQEPAIKINNKQDLFSYWKRMHTTYPFAIDNMEFLEIGKTSKFRNTMKEFGFIIDAEIHFNEYGKVTRLHNTILEKL